MSAGLVSAGLTSVLVLLSWICAGAAAAVAASSLKSPAVGGGTLAGSGRGIAASIANSAALLRD
jgi:hypothetical protein